MGDVETLRGILPVELRRPGRNKERVGFDNKADIAIAQMGSHSGFRCRPGADPWQLGACLNVFRAVSEALLNPYRETFADNAIFDATVDPISATRWKFNPEPADRGPIPNAGVQGIAWIEPCVDGKQIRFGRIHEPWGARQGSGPGMTTLVRQSHDHERQRSEERPMLLRHVVPNDCAPLELDTITHAGKALNRLLAGVKGRRGHS